MVSSVRYPTGDSPAICQLSEARAGDGRTDASAYPVTITPLGITEPRRTLIRKGSDALGGVLCAISQG